ncbi:prepilin peptidase [Sphingomonas rhizophila]|uniref:Prepilin peptidase n=1 Tax=Sphingomonas rhizophila TaxID=2071607 RepID=A0A7G9SE19_9SPHN|nr:prepilin peptidase [Sphingomonas rhizophila]QNN66094.1 prepilin peptidase [Sphingomonas rhizophila]
MTNDLFTELLLITLALMLLAAAVWDLRTRTIPDPLNIAIALLAPVFWWSAGIELWPDVALRIAAALAIFLVFYGLFCLGGMGGGDVKMVGAVALWFGWKTTITFFVLTTLAGGVVSLATYIHHKSRGSKAPAGAESEERPEVPYGVAIAFAGLWLLAQRFLNHFAG